MQFQIWRKKTRKEIADSSRSEFLEKLSANNFALSDAEGNTSGWLNGRGITDLPLFRTPLPFFRSLESQFFGK